MKTVNYSIVVFLVLCAFSCKKEKQNYNDGMYETILINVADSKEIDIRDSINYNVKEISLELSDNSLLTDIEQIEITDNQIIIFDNHRLLVFDRNGNFLHNIGKRGLGPEEHTNINSFFLEAGNVCIYDDNLMTLFTFDRSGKFIGSKRTFNKMASLYPAGNNKLIGKKKYQGDRVKTPALAMLDKELVLVSDINNRYLTSGVGVVDYCYEYDNRILYWEFLNDTIYSINNMALLPQYYVDFQKNKIPPIEIANKELGEIIEYVNLNISKFATGIRYVQEDASNIRFIFTFQEKIHYAKYNKTTKKASVSYFYDSNKQMKFQYIMKYHDKNIILVIYDMEDEDSNPQLLFINDNLL